MTPQRAHKETRRAARRLNHVPEQSHHWLPPVAPEPPAAVPPHNAHEAFGKPREPLLKRGGGALAALAALAAKGKALLLLLPKLKLLTTSGTMLVSIAAYSFLWGWKFAIGFVILLFVHEMGHVIQLRREGVEASAPVFIPFMGAVVWAKQLGGNALAEARVGLAGPVLGSIGAAACLPIAALTGNDLFTALAFTGFFLNLFNLAPMLPLDGGRAMAAMAPWMWLVGLAAMAAAAILFPNPIILLILLFGAMETWRRWKLRRDSSPETQSYYRVKPLHRALVAAVYIGLIAALVVGMDAAHLVRDFNDV
jgi:Zn-dependent protease